MEKKNKGLIIAIIIAVLVVLGIIVGVVVYKLNNKETNNEETIYFHSGNNEDLKLASNGTFTLGYYDEIDMTDNGDSEEEIENTVKYMYELIDSQGEAYKEKNLKGTYTKTENGYSFIADDGTKFTGTLVNGYIVLKSLDSYEYVLFNTDNDKHGNEMSESLNDYFYQTFGIDLEKTTTGVAVSNCHTVSYARNKLSCLVEISFDKNSIDKNILDSSFVEHDVYDNDSIFTTFVYATFDATNNYSVLSLATEHDNIYAMND